MTISEQIDFSIHNKIVWITLQSMCKAHLEEELPK